MSVKSTSIDRFIPETVRSPVLPIEVLMEMLSYLGPKETAIAARVCKVWKDLAMDNLHWKSLIEREPRFEGFPHKASYTGAGIIDYRASFKWCLVAVEMYKEEGISSTSQQKIQSL